MKYKISIILILGIATFLFSVFFVLDRLDLLSDEYGQSIVFFSATLIFLSLILLFLRTEVYATWKKFAIIYLPIAFLLVFTTPVAGGFLKMDRELMSLWTAGIFLLVSLSIITYKSWQLRKSKTRIMKTPDRSLAEKRNKNGS